MSRETKIADMREVLRVLEDHPEIPMPYFGMGPGYFSLTRGFGSAELHDRRLDRTEAALCLAGLLTLIAASEDPDVPKAVTDLIDKLDESLIEEGL